MADRPRSIFKLIYEIGFCLVLTGNVGWVLFDLTYLAGIPYTHLTFRDVYLERWPDLVHRYDRLKGIEAHRYTEEFLQKTGKLRKEMLAAGQVTDAAAQGLADLAATMHGFINQSPFTTARKEGNFERIKNLMRKHHGLDSAKQSFSLFFSPANFAGERLQTEWNFFQEEIEPLIRRNYFRHIGEDGEFIDEFYRYDLFFVAFFALDFLVRWIYSLRGGALRRWYLFPVRRWYDLFLLLVPHHMAWLRLGRLLSLYMRLKANRFLPGEGILPGIIHDNAAVIAEEISGLVLLNILEQTQNVLRTRSLADIAVDNQDLRSIDDLIDSQLAIMACDVVPELEPEISEMVQFSINKALEPWLLSPIGPALRLGLLGVHKSVRDGLRAALASKGGVERLTAILKKSSTVLLEGAAEPANLSELQGHMVRVLEGLKRQVASSIKK